MATLFTSDTHFYHARIIELSKRPFTHVDEMHEQLIKRWNSVVKPGDTVYHLGDFSFGNEENSIAMLRRLNGMKILVFGNHDYALRKRSKYVEAWHATSDLFETTIDGQRIVMCHFPLLTWNQAHRGSWNLHGHCHGNLTPDAHSLRLDVGVDCWDYTPVSFEQVREAMAKKTFRPVDHHGKKKYLT